jgi:hypothetical protein
MSALVRLLLLVAWQAPSAAAPLDLETAAARFETGCAAGAQGADCETLRATLEDVLYDRLVRLTNARVTVERAVVRTATRAQNPLLAAYALALLDAGFGPADVPYVRAALDSPFPAVRAAAVDLSKWFETDLLRAPTQRAREALQGYTDRRATLFAADLVPPAAGLGAPLYPGSTYSYLAGSRARPVFVTADDPQKVAAFFAKGKPTFTAAQMAAAVERREAEEQARHDAAAEEEADPNDMAAAMAQAMQLMAAMNAGGDPMKTMIETSQAKEAAFHDWTADTTRLEGIGEPRFVIVEEKQGVPMRVVAVYRDPALGATAIAYPAPPGRRNSGMDELATDPDAMVRWQRWQEILGQ